MASDIVIKVNPAELKAKAGEVRQCRGQIENLMTDMGSAVKTLSNYWKAASGENFIQKYNQVTHNVQDALDFLDKNAKNLEDAATAYEATMSQNESLVNSLSSKDIFV